MKTLLKLITFALLLNSCNIKEQLERHDKAQKKADFIIENLTDHAIINEFPQKYFPKEDTEILMSDIEQYCDWDNRKGKFVDFFTMNSNGKNQVAFIYEYFLKCDSIRFILTYDLELEEPVLIGFAMEPIEKPSLMIIDPSKQLLNQK